jgi:uncharacterized membrane protein
VCGCLTAVLLRVRARKGKTMDLGSTFTMTPKKWATLVYCLQGLGFISGITWIVGVVINYVLADAVTSDPTAASHFRYQIRTFWYTLALLVISSALVFTVFLSPVGVLGYVALYVWAIYRVVRGAVSLSEDRAI